MPRNRKTEVVLIENGFQQDYMINLIRGLSKLCDIVFVGSDDFLKYQFESNVIFKNLRGSHNEYVAIYYKIFRVTRYYFRLFSFLLRTRINIIHIQWLRYYIVDGVFFPLFSRVLGKKIVYTVHDVLPHDKNNSFNRFLFRIIYNCPQELVVHTEFIKKRLIHEFRISEKKIHIVEHGVYQVNHTDYTTYQNARMQLEINETDFVFLFFGRIARYKGIKMLIHSFNKLKKCHKNLKLIVAGKLANDFTKEFENILKTHDLNDILTKIYFIEEKEVEQVFNAVNVTVLPYSEASQSGVLFLSYAYGVPVIAPNLGDFPNYVKNGKTGLIFTHENEQDFQDSLKDSISFFEGYCDKRKQSIKDFASENYSWDQSCKQLIQVYINERKK